MYILGGKDFIILILYISSVVLIIVLLWYLYRERIYDPRNRRIRDTYCQKHSNRKKIYNSKTMLEKHKRTLEPEKDILVEHSLGDELDNIQTKMDDPLSSDAFANLKSEESSSDRLIRSLKTASCDGPQLEGMQTPIDEFERNAMVRQLNKRQTMYGSQNYELSEADKISELNM